MHEFISKLDLHGLAEFISFKPRQNTFGTSEKKLPFQPFLLFK